MTGNPLHINRAVYERLLELRRNLAQRSSKEPFRIFTSETLNLLASELPRTIEQLEAIKGMGPKKVSDFGVQILDAIQESLAQGDSATAQEDENIMSVGKFLDRINSFLMLQRVFIAGEVSELNLHPTGVYLTLKDKEDQKSVLSCYISPSMYRSFGVELEEGLEVKAGGFPSIYKAKGRLSFQIDSIELSGEGSLKRSYELLKKKLEAEGLFSRKRQLPQCIERIAIVTSRTGAVLDDFRKNLEPLACKMSFCDVRVEGAQSVSGICRVVTWINKSRNDNEVLVIIRGGGSWEDLQAFNNELVARTIFASKIPTLVGIGHDRDVPIASLVADYASSTPTATAHVINQSWRGVRQSVPTLSHRLFSLYERELHRRKSFVDNSASKLLGEFNKLLLKHKHLSHRLKQLFEYHLEKSKSRLASYEKYLIAVDPERNLKLGYSILFTKDHKVVKSIDDVHKGDEIRTRLFGGEVTSRVEDVQEIDIEE